MVLGVELDCLCEFFAVEERMISEWSCVEWYGNIYIDSLNCFAAKSLLPSAFSASAML